MDLKNGYFSPMKKQILEWVKESYFSFLGEWEEQIGVVYFTESYVFSMVECVGSF